MGAVKKQKNVQVKNPQKRRVLANGKPNKNHPGTFYNSPHPRPPHPFNGTAMRLRPPFPPNRMPPPGPMRARGPMPPPPLFRPPMMRPRPPMMGPPPLMRPPPPMMGPPPPHRFPPRMPMPPRPPMAPMPHRPPPMAPMHMPPMRMPPNKMRQLKQKIQPNSKQRLGGAGIVKKKGAPFDLGSPWVSEEMRAEFANKDKYYLAAKASSSLDDWAKFKTQRIKCDRMYKTAKIEYIGQHPEEVFDSDNSSDHSDDEIDDWNENANNYETLTNNSANLFCDTCERSFTHAQQMQRHMQQHRVCGIDGCTFVAHAKIVEKHIDMQHVTGLYYRIAKTETPEDVTKWIEERKKRYPSKENIEKRRKEQEEMLKRGELIQGKKSRFGKHTKKGISLKAASQRGRKRLLSLQRFNRIPPKRKKPAPKSTPAPVSLINDHSDWNGNLPPFEGTSEMYEKDVPAKNESEYDDSEWLNTENDAPKIQLSNSLGALIGAYRSSDESDDEICVPKSDIVLPDDEICVPNAVTPDNEICVLESNVVSPDDAFEVDSAAPNEEKISRVDPLAYLEPEPDKKITNTKRRTRLRTRNRKNPKTTKTNVTQKSAKRRVTLLERLLAPEIKHERNVILQCVRYVIENNFFDNASECERSEVVCDNVGTSENNSDMSICD